MGSLGHLSRSRYRLEFGCELRGFLFPSFPSFRSFVGSKPELIRLFWRGLIGPSRSIHPSLLDGHLSRSLGERGRDG